MKKFLKTVLVLILTAGVLGGGLFLYQSKHDADLLEEALPLETLVDEVRSRPGYVPFDQISENLCEAIVSVEDARFYSHSGYDIIGLCRAALSQVLPFMARSGGSTITQQTVKNLYGMFEAGPSWKGEEILLAVRLEKILSKEEILALYLNIINFGDGYTGVGAASAGYFNVLPANLDLAQASILAGIPQSPSNYQLSDRFDQAKAKQRIVLNSMVRNNYISQEEAESVYEEPIQFYNGSMWMTGTAWNSLSRKPILKTL